MAAFRKRLPWSPVYRFRENPFRRRSPTSLCQIQSDIGLETSPGSAGRRRLSRDDHNKARNCWLCAPSQWYLVLRRTTVTIYQCAKVRVQAGERKRVVGSVASKRHGLSELSNDGQYRCLGNRSYGQRHAGKRHETRGLGDTVLCNCFSTMLLWPHTFSVYSNSKGMRQFTPPK